MSSRRVVFVLFLSMAVAVSSLTVAVADGASADGTASVNTGDLSDYYLNQLTVDEKAIYDGLKSLTVDGLKKSNSKAEYYMEYTIDSSKYNYPGSDAASASMCRAWEALKLSEPFAWITWGSDKAPKTIKYVEGSSFMFTIAVGYISGCSDLDTAKTEISKMLTECENALGELVKTLDLRSKDSYGAVKAINDYICGKAIYYSDEKDYCNSVYGALVAADGDGNHGIVCEGYAALVQALCDEIGIPCITVFGLAAGVESNGYHAWNIVCVGSGTDLHVYAYDATFNDTGTDKVAYLLVGSLTVRDGYTFSMTHQAFEFCDDWYGTDCPRPFSFISHSVEESGHNWPKDASPLDILIEFAPWIIIALICVLLAYILWSMGKKGE